MTIFIVTIVLVAILLVLAYPFVAQRGGRAMMEDAAEELAQRLRRSRDRVYEEKYQQQLKNARLQAAGLMRQQQQVQQKLADVEAAVDEELRQIASAADRKPEDESA